MFGPVFAVGPAFSAVGLAGRRSAWLGILGDLVPGRPDLPGLVPGRPDWSVPFLVRSGVSRSPSLLWCGGPGGWPGFLVPGSVDLVVRSGSWSWLRGSWSAGRPGAARPGFAGIAGSTWRSGHLPIPFKNWVLISRRNFGNLIFLKKSICRSIGGNGQSFQEGILEIDSSEIVPITAGR